MKYSQLKEVVRIFLSQALAVGEAKPV